MPPLVLSGVFVAIGVLLVGLAVPPIRGRVAPNLLYGVRVRSTLADPAVWYAVNAVSGRELLALGVLLIVAALTLPWVAGRWAGDLLTGGLTLGTLTLAWRATRMANRLSAANQRADSSGESPQG
jgi:hypothetical protein